MKLNLKTLKEKDTPKAKTIFFYNILCRKLYCSLWGQHKENGYTLEWLCKCLMSGEWVSGLKDIGSWKSFLELSTWNFFCPHNILTLLHVFTCASIITYRYIYLRKEKNSPRLCQAYLLAGPLAPIPEVVRRKRIASVVRFWKKIILHFVFVVSII